MEKENKISLREWKLLQERAKEEVKNPLDAFNDQPMIPTENAREAREKLNKAELVLTLEEYRELSEKAKEMEQKTEETTLTYRPDGEKSTTMVQTHEASEAQRLLNLGKVMLTPEEKKELEELVNNTLTIAIDGEASRGSAEVDEAKRILSKAEVIEPEKEIKDRDSLPIDVVKDPWDLEEYGTTREKVNEETKEMLEEMKAKAEKGDNSQDNHPDVIR